MPEWLHDALAETLAQQVIGCWQQIRACEIVLDEIGSRFDGADPLKPVSREALIQTRQKLSKVGDDPSQSQNFHLFSFDGYPTSDASMRAAVEFVRAVEADKADADVRPYRSNDAQLSGREVEVLRLMAAGKSNQQIANELVISLSTVLHHITNILTKTGCSNRTEAAAYAHRHGLS